MKPCLVLYDFDLVLPNRATFVKELAEFNQGRESNSLPLFWPDVLIEDDSCELSLLNDELELVIFIDGEQDVVLGNETFRVSPEFQDTTNSQMGHAYVEYLCEKFGGTVVGVYVKDCTLEPVRIVQGKRVPVKLALVDSDEE